MHRSLLSAGGGYLLLVLTACSTGKPAGSRGGSPRISLSVQSAIVDSGSPARLTWRTREADGCRASDGWSGNRATSGSESSGPLTVATAFTLVCTGTGGSDSVSVGVGIMPPAGRIFPLHVEAGKRYLIDAQGRPFLIHGDSPWSLMVMLTRPEVDEYLEDRRRKGFNTILVNLIEHAYTTTPPLNAYDAAPFTTPGDFSTPNEAYFAQAEYVIARAREKGILVLLAPTYLGYGGGHAGWYQEMTANGAAKLTAYGQYVATRFHNYDNILWVNGGDYDPPEKILVRAVATGIRGVDPRALQTFHGARRTSALGFFGTDEPWLTVNAIYSDVANLVLDAGTDYLRSPMPFFLIEGNYENDRITENGFRKKERLSARGVRQQAYQADLSGATGQVMGNDPMWYFGLGWSQVLDSDGAVTLVYLRSLLESFPWWTLAPDLSRTFATGTATAAKAMDGSFALAYLPDTTSVTVELGQLAGPNVTARWYDPTRGIHRSIAGSPFAAKGRRTFQPAGRNGKGDDDWVLVLRSGS